MPTYQYVCANPEHKHEFELVQSFTDPAVTACPECGAPVRKVYGSVGGVFKGSGFYRTDSRKSESPAPATGKESSTTSKESSSSTPAAASTSAPASSGSSSKAASD